MVKVYFLGPETLLKCGDPWFVCGPQSYTTAPCRVTFDTGLLLAVDPKVVKGHTLWHMYTANNVETAI